MTVLQDRVTTSQLLTMTVNIVTAGELITVRTDMVLRCPHRQVVGTVPATTVRAIMPTLDTIQIGVKLEPELTTAQAVTAQAKLHHRVVTTEVVTPDLVTTQRAIIPAALACQVLTLDT